MIKIRCFVEGEKYKADRIPKELIEKNYFNKDNDGYFIAKITGLSHRIERDEVQSFLFLPKGYHASQLGDDNEKKTLAKIIFKTLRKYTKTTKLTDFEQDWLGENNSQVFGFELIEWLIRDWQHYGFFSIQSRNFELNGSGKIDWKKTLKTTYPIIYEEEVIYPSLWTFKNINMSDSLVTDIHKSIIREIIQNFGWLYDLPKMNFDTCINLSDDKKIIFLRKKLNEVNAGREIKLLKNLISYLSEKESNRQQMTLVTPYFYAIYEKILQKQFQHNREINKFVPKPYWILDGDLEKRYSRQIPDILIETEDNGLAILDAKYYSITEINEDQEILDASIKKFPGWEAIVKQLYYSTSMGNRYSNTENIFVMPENIDESYRYVGYTGVEGYESIFGIILAYTVNIKKILNDYLNDENNSELLSDIINDAMNNRTEIFSNLAETKSN